MLVLSRKKQETLYIGQDVAITVVDIRGDKVRLGITAPRELAIRRDDMIKQPATKELELTAPAA